MAGSTLTAIGRVTKKAFIGVLNGTYEKEQAIVETTADLVKVTIDGVSDFTFVIDKRVGEIMSGAIEATTEIGGDLLMTIKCIVHGIVKGGADAGADVAKTAVAATEGAIKEATRAGINTFEATEEAVSGALEAGYEIGAYTYKAVTYALTTSIKGAKAMIKPPGETDKI